MSLENIQYTDLNESTSEALSTFRNYVSFDFILPSLIFALSIFSLITNVTGTKPFDRASNFSESKGGGIKNAGVFNILSSEDLALGIKDTVYTDKDCWLELKIDKQMLYQHWRNGRIEEYPVSSGNNHQGDPTALESRPGLFAIFHKEEHHISSQFSSSNMYHFMPFNQGIGFHSIDGTDYYAYLGAQPSSHGCIRMKHQDAEKLYKECPMGTLVIASKGYSARTVAFAPEDFRNEKSYSKQDYKVMMSENLYNLLNQKYYLKDRRKFIIDPKIIPISGIYNSYDRKVPEKQIMPRSFVADYATTDRLSVINKKEILEQKNFDEFIKLVGNDSDVVPEDTKPGADVSKESILIKEYFHNPIGILPYFGPRR